jgi:hypothetical protein
MVGKIAHFIIVPYLWWFGFDMDEESIQKCHDAIDLRKEATFALGNEQEKEKNEN